MLKVLAGQLQPLAGICRVTAANVHLDQRLANLEPELTVLEQIQAANRTAPEADLRMRLAQLGLDARKIVALSGSLSGGERLKAALACVLYADAAPQLLLLDEPGNHLDLPSLEALEDMLRSYQAPWLSCHTRRIHEQPRVDGSPAGYRAGLAAGAMVTRSGN